jgi:Putative peptidoglycan binding domain
MKFETIIFLAAMAVAPPTRADDDSKTPSRSSDHPASSTTATANTAPKAAPQAVSRKPVGPTANPSVRPVYPSTITPGERRILPTNRLRPSVPSVTPRTRLAPNRTAFVTPNQRTNSTLGNRRVRIPTHTGNALTLSQARAQCSRDHHDRDWWRHHHKIIVFYGGGYWFWNAGWWFPAWGYSPYYNNYVYDGPIYGGGELSPGDVTAQVQEALAEQGYYYGPIDGVLGPETRDALLRFQADHGLATTATIDEPTLDSLGLT